MSIRRGGLRWLNDLQMLVCLHLRQVLDYPRRPMDFQ